MSKTCTTKVLPTHGGHQNPRLSPPNFVAASLKACTFNANGLSTLVPNGTGHEHRYTQIMKFFHCSKLHVMGLQEPHIPDEQTLLNLHEQFSKRDIKLLTNLSPKGRGGGGQRSFTPLHGRTSTAGPGPAGSFSSGFRTMTASNFPSLSAISIMMPPSESTSGKS